MTEPEQPRPGFERGRGPAGSTSDAASETGVSDEHPPRPVRGADDHAAPQADQQSVPSDVRDTWNADRVDLGPGGIRGDERSPAPTAGDPFEDVGREDVEADRRSYRRTSGV